MSIVCPFCQNETFHIGDNGAWCDTCGADLNTDALSGVNSIIAHSDKVTEEYEKLYGRMQTVAAWINRKMGECPYSLDPSPMVSETLCCDVDCSPDMDRAKCWEEWILKSKAWWWE